MSADAKLERTLTKSFEETLAALPDALGAEGFGVLTEIDLQGTLKKKLNVDTRRYKILGACNPPFAHRAIEADLRAGLMLPCNVVVYEADGGGAVVMAVDPSRSVASLGDPEEHPELVRLAAEVRERLVRVLDRLA